MNRYLIFVIWWAAMDQVLLRHRFLNQYLFSYAKSRLQKTTYVFINLGSSLNRVIEKTRHRST